MAATAAQVVRLRRMVDEPDDTTYTDAELAALLESFPLVDARGEEPYAWDSATPPAQEANPVWIPSYDFHSAAAVVWEEKAATLTQDYDFAADGASYKRSQAYEQHMKRVRYHLSRRAARTRQVFVADAPTGREWIGNINNPYE